MDGGVLRKPRPLLLNRGMNIDTSNAAKKMDEPIMDSFGGHGRLDCVL
jgi:hypothetical protein